MVGDIEGFLLENNAFTFPLMSGFVEKQHQKATDSYNNAEPGIYEIQADAGGKDNGRYDEVLYSMDRFEFDFHDYKLIKR